MTRAQSTMIIRTVAGLILLAAGIGVSIIFTVRVSAVEWDNYGGLQLLVEVPMLINCWALTAVGWWLMYPRQWMGFVRAAIWFAIASIGWVVSFKIVFFWNPCVYSSCIWNPPPLYILGLATFLLFIAIVILEGLWQLARTEKGRYSYAIQTRTETVEKNTAYKFAVGALVCGICSLLFLHGGFVFGLLGITLGVLSSRQLKRTQAERGSGLATAGIICGSIGFIISVAYAIWFFAIHGWATIG